MINPVLKDPMIGNSIKIDWARLEWTENAQMNKLGSLYGYESPTASGVIGARKLRNDVLIYSDNESSCTLRNAKDVKVESNL